MKSLLRNLMSQQLHQHQLQLQHVGLLVTAHHKDDSEETLLLKLLRGVHLTHIAGLDVLLRDDPSDSEHDSTIDRSRTTIYWARPLVHVRKSTLQSFLLENNMPWREDATNRSDKYLRNRVRNELIPLLHDLLGDGEESKLLLEQRLEHADDVVDNDGELAALGPQVEQLHQRYLAYANAGSATGSDA